MKWFFRLIAKIIAIIAMIILIIVMIVGLVLGYTYVFLGLALWAWGLLALGALIIAFVISPRGAQEGVNRVINATESAAKAVGKGVGALIKGGAKGVADGLGLKGIGKYILYGVLGYGTFLLVTSDKFSFKKGLIGTDKKDDLNAIKSNSNNVPIVEAEPDVLNNDKGAGHNVPVYSLGA